MDDYIKLHQSALMNDIFISDVDEAFSVFANEFDSVSAESFDSADTILLEFMDIYENNKDYKN